ncbi:Protein of unknown function [Bacillus cytotoxicus]|uniref:Uncharacterized protein n=1 Tax=Bacillus cytotoxicus TaxID=580165 RepID=A0AAX2CKY3_9BACI|nr:Protein of unknown function [Bacillus cytotoxicus]
MDVIVSKVHNDKDTLSLQPF